MIVKSVARLFESWIDPFGRRGDLRPPETTFAFVWHYVRQAKWPFVGMAFFGGAVAVLEAALFFFVGLLLRARLPLLRSRMWLLW